MGARGHFGSGVHPCLLLHLAEPFQSRSTDSLEASGLGARLPDAGAEYLYARGGELSGGGEHLLLGLGTARAGDYERLIGVDAGEGYGLFIFSGMFKWTPYLTGFAIGGFMGSYWGAGDTIGGIMFSESSPTNLRSSVTVINTLLNGVMGGLATVITMILLPIIPERMFGYMYLGLTVPGLVGAIVIMWLFVGETRGLDLKTVTGTEWDKPKKVKEEQQDGEF